MRNTLATIAVGLTLLAGATRTNAASVTLYSGAGVPNNPNFGTTTDNQTWLSFTNVPGGAFQTPTGNGAILNTTANNSIYAGYSNYTTAGSLVNSSFPTLDRTAGYSISFNVQIISESRTNNDRAGFSVIAISSDKRGIEIGFQQTASSGLIFAQSDGVTPNLGGGTTPLFNQGENVSFNTNAATNYTLTIANNIYQLSANNSQILTGSLRDYSAFSGAIDPYETPNFLFFGDDTTSAQANINFRSASVNTNSVAVPYKLSPTLGILGLAAWGAALRIKKIKQ